MSYKYYRFHLLELENIEPLKLQVYEETYQLLTSQSENLGVVRIACDLKSPKKSISFLCKSNDDLTEQQSKLINFLSLNSIAVSTEIESELIEEKHNNKDEHPHHHEHQSHQHNEQCHHQLVPHHEQEHHHEHAHHHEQEHHHTPEDNSHHGHHHHNHHDNHWIKAALGLVWGSSLLVISLVSLNIPLIAYSVMTGLSALMTFFLGGSVYKSAWQALREKRWDMSTLYAISTLAIVVISVLSVFVPGLPLMFETAPLVLGFWHLGEGLEHSLLNKINTKLDIRDCISPYVTLKNSAEKRNPVATLIPNDIIVINAGEVIPVDGISIESTSLYTTRIDGSPFPKTFNAGDAVKSGMVLPSHISKLEIRVTKTYQNSYLSSIAKNIKKANDQKAPIEKLANKILKYFVPGLLAVAAVSGLIIGFLFGQAIAVQCVISVLVSACPCTLSLITPLAVKIGMKKAAEQGIVFKDGLALQTGADIDTVVFDLNGTLTEGNILVKEIRITDKKLLAHVALLESHSKHPTAKIIQAHIEQQTLHSDLPLKISDVDLSHHSGIKSLINGETFMIGNKDMLKENGVYQFPAPYDNPENGSIYIVRGSSVIGQINLTDELRSDSITTIKHLKAQGKNVHICTGADRDTAERYAKLLDIPSDNIANSMVGVTTENGKISKTDYINRLKKNGCKIAMVGDAANDIEAIASAHLGIAVKSSIGDTLTENHAGVVIQKGLLVSIPIAFDASKKTKSNIYQNLFVSLAYNSGVTLVAGGLLVGFGLALNPVLGIALMVLESTIVLANLYRLKNEKLISFQSSQKNACNDELTKESTPKLLHALNQKHECEATREPFEKSTCSAAFTPPSKKSDLAFFSTKNHASQHKAAGPESQNPFVVLCP